MKSFYTSLTQLFPPAGCFKIDALFTVKQKGGQEGGSPKFFGSMKSGVFFTNAQSRFAIDILDGVFGPLRLASPHAVSAQKALAGSKPRELL